MLQPCGGNFTTLLFAPDTALTRSVVAAAAASLVFPGAEPDAACHRQGFATARDLLTAYMQQPPLQGATVAAVLFNAPAGTLDTNSVGNYTIAMSRSTLYMKAEAQKRDFKWPAISERRLTYLGNNE